MSLIEQWIRKEGKGPEQVGPAVFFGKMVPVDEKSLLKHLTNAKYEEEIKSMRDLVRGLAFAVAHLHKRNHGKETPCSICDECDKYVERMYAELRRWGS